MKKKVWIFGACAGYDYIDNTKSLFEYVSCKNKESAIWLTLSKNTLENIRKKGYKAELFYSVRGIYYALISKYVVLSYSYNDVSLFVFLLARWKKIIQLFHGTPLKRLDKEISRSFFNKFLQQTLYVYMGKRYDLIISATPKVKSIFSNFFGVNQDIISVTGYARNDILTSGKSKKSIRDALNINNNAKILLYMPTYREYNKKFNLFSKYGFDVKKMESMLRQFNAHLIIKLHHRDYEKSQSILAGTEKNKYVSVINSGNNIDVYELVKMTDILLTDYSSIYFDYLLLNRPIIFTAFDKNEYEKLDRGFYFDYDNVTPGAKTKNWNETFYEIEKIFQENDEYEEKRLKIKKEFNTYTDNKSSERVYKIITEL